MLGSKERQEAGGSHMHVRWPLLSSFSSAHVALPAAAHTGPCCVARAWICLHPCGHDQWMSRALLAFPCQQPPQQCSECA